MSSFRDGLNEGLSQVRESAKNGPAALRRFLADPRSAVGGASLLPLIVLFGHTFIDAIDGSGFNVILPEIQKDFHITLQQVSSIGASALFISLLLGVPIAVKSEATTRRTLYLGAGAVVAALFAALSGLASTLGLFVFARSAFGLGLRLNDPVQQSLMADYYPVSSRPTVFAGRDGITRFGRLIGPLYFGGITLLFGWRAALISVAIPSALLAFYSFRLHNPVRGAPEREAMGLPPVEEEKIDAPTLRDAFRVLKRVGTVRRLWLALPFLVGGYLALGILVPLYSEEVFGLNAGQRGLVSAVGEAGAIFGLLVATPILSRYLTSANPERVFPMLAVQGVTGGVFIAAICLAPNLAVFVVAFILMNLNGAVLTPAIGVLLSLVVPARVRTISFATAALVALPGLFVLPFATGIGDTYGLRWGIALSIPMFLIGGFILASSGALFVEDMRGAFAALAAEIEIRQAKEAGTAKLLVCRGIDVKYGQVQVLFDVDFDVEEGEIVALLGTNGAGKSTLLRAISGTAQASSGTVVFDGIDITSTDAPRVAGLGVIQMPGGRGVFPTLTVEENLRVATWLNRDDVDYLNAAIARCLEIFPVLRDRFDQPAGNLSGGEQQMLALSQAFIAKPKLLCIDELSLGLAPQVVQQLLAMVETLHAEGVTVVLVEQSVNVALTVCKRAVFLEKGEVRFNGPTADLFERPEILRSVFIEGASAIDAPSNGNGKRTKGHAVVARPKIDLAKLDKLGVRLPVVLEVKDIRKAFGGIRAVNGVSFQLHAGEVLGLIGTNGAGKTTIFDLISGFQEPDTGTIELDGLDITQTPAFLRSVMRLGRSFQDARLFPSLTVRETIAIALERHLEMTNPIAAAIYSPAQRAEEFAIQHRVEELIELLGLDAFRDKFISELSTGTRRIVDLAASLAHEPKVLLLDEPSSGIAQREAEALAPLIDRIKTQLGCALLVIEHDMPLISTVSDRLIALETGAVIAQGSPAAVLADPIVVASYLGTDENVIARSGATQRSTSPRRKVRVKGTTR
jgi:branched-chain amino acid transport system ATP-binding protein